MAVWPLETHLLRIDQSEAYYMAGLQVAPKWLLQAQAIRHPVTRLHFLASRWQLAHVLGRNIEVLGKDEFGRWAHPSVEISTSHAPGIAAVILSGEHRLGIDVEPIRDKAAKLLERFANYEELSPLLDAHHPPTLLWSIKEAVYKWYGLKGLLFRIHMRVEQARFGQSNEGEAEVNLHAPGFFPMALTVRFRLEGPFYVCWVATEGRLLPLKRLP